MSPDDLNRHQIERLAFIRYLFTLGVQHAQGAGPQSSVAILLFHDAVELFLVLASETLHVKRADGFMNYFQPLDEVLKPGPPMPERESMRRLNDARNALKHKGLRADRADLEHHTEAVIRFFEEATPRIFGADIDSVSLVAVVRCEGAQPYLQAAELAYKEHRAADGSRACAEALDEVLRDYEQRQSDRWLESPFSPIHRLRNVWLTEGGSRAERKLRECIDALNKTVIDLHERTRLLSLGVDYRRYARFQRLTPHVQHTFGGSRHVLGDPPDITTDELRFCIDFVIDTALQLQMADADVGHPTTGIAGKDE